MHPQLESLLNQAENRYLNPDELSLLSQYVDSLPQRLETYRQLRERELEIMQRVADQLQAELPQESTANLERSIKNAILTLRYCGLAMLLNDEKLLEERLLSWLTQSVQTYNTQAIDTVLYRLLNQQLGQNFNAQQLIFLAPPLKLAQTTLLKLTQAHVK